MLIEEEVREWHVWWQNNKSQTSKPLHDLWRDRKEHGIVQNSIGLLMCLLTVMWTTSVCNGSAGLGVRAALPTVLSFALLFQSIAFIMDFFIAYERTGVYILIVIEMLSKDVTLTLAVLIPFLLAFSLAIWPLMVSTDVMYTHPQDAWEVGQIIWSLLMMTFTGATFARRGGVSTDLLDGVTLDFLIKDSPDETL